MAYERSSVVGLSSEEYNEDHKNLCFIKDCLERVYYKELVKNIPTGRYICYSHGGQSLSPFEIAQLREIIQWYERLKSL